MTVTTSTVKNIRDFNQERGIIANLREFDDENKMKLPQTRQDHQ